MDIEIFSCFSQFYAFLLKITVYEFYPKWSRLIRIKFGHNLEKITRPLLLRPWLTVTTPMSTYPTRSTEWSTRAWWFWEAPMIPKAILIHIIYPHPNITFRNGKALWCLERSQLSIIRTQLKKLHNTNLLTTLLPWICILWLIVTVKYVKACVIHIYLWTNWKICICKITAH